MRPCATLLPPFTAPFLRCPLLQGLYKVPGTLTALNTTEGFRDYDRTAVMQKVRCLCSKAPLPFAPSLLTPPLLPPLLGNPIYCCCCCSLRWQAGASIWASITSGAAEEDPALLSPFLLHCYADLKKYTFFYWLAFPVIKPPAVRHWGLSPFLPPSSTPAQSPHNIPSPPLPFPVIKPPAVRH